MDEVLAELDRLTSDNPDGFTREDVQRMFNVGEQNALRKMRAWKLRGQIECAGRREGVGMDGRRTLVPVYRVTPPAPA